MPAKKKSAAEKPTAKARKPTAKAAKPAAKAKKPTAKAKASTGPKPGDAIVIESEKVGSPPREGEVLEILHGQVSVSYRVRWQDGHESVIAPRAGNSSIVPSQRTR